MSEYKLTKEEEEKLAKMKEFVKEMDSIPESEKFPISSNLQKRMQSEQDTSNAVRKMSDEEREKLDQTIWENLE